MPQPQPITTGDIERALRTPEDVFERPMDVVRAEDVPLGTRLRILKKWEQAARDLQRAADEGMGGGDARQLDEINEALKLVDPMDDAHDNFGAAPTKI